MTNTKSIIWRRIQEKAERMASQEHKEPLNERMSLCWDAHCYKYIDTSGKINFIISQDEFYKLTWLMGFHETVYEAFIYNENKLPKSVKELICGIFDKKIPDYKVLEALLSIPPFWDDREKKLKE